MSARPPKLDAAALDAVLGGRIPDALGRTGRVRLLGEAFTALLDGRLPSRKAALFLGGAGLAWLAQGGSLEKDYFRVTKAKSHITPARLWEQMQDRHQDERHGDDDAE